MSDISSDSSVSSQMFEDVDNLNNNSVPPNISFWTERTGHTQENFDYRYLRHFGAPNTRPTKHHILQINEEIAQGKKILMCFQSNMKKIPGQKELADGFIEAIGMVTKPITLFTPEEMEANKLIWSNIGSNTFKMHQDWTWKIPIDYFVVLPLNYEPFGSKALLANSGVGKIPMCTFYKPKAAYANYLWEHSRQFNLC